MARMGNVQGFTMGGDTEVGVKLRDLRTSIRLGWL